ncbi:hypothetical protein RFI_01303, partial [Reticulomyxa filosa]
SILLCFFLKDNTPERYAQMNAAYVEFFKSQKADVCARITAGCGNLALGSDVEIDGVAFLPGKCPHANCKIFIFLSQTKKQNFQLLNKLLRCNHFHRKDANFCCVSRIFSDNICRYFSLKGIHNSYFFFFATYDVDYL